MNAVSDFIQRYAQSAVDVRRHLHQRPELSGKEFETTQFLARQLSAAGIPFQWGPEKRGLVVDLGNPDATQRLGLRADMDALAIKDGKSATYRSQVDSVMHACGHDAHSAILLATIKTLHQMFEINPPEHAIRAIFQPEEETATGALRMIEFGVLDNVTAIVAAHVDPLRAVGDIGIRSGVVTAHCDEIFVEVRGRSGHAARPAETVDPIEITANFISNCYTAVPRYTDSARLVVLSFTAVHGGQQHNVIPDQVNILGTMRSLNSSARENAIARIHETAEEMEGATGAKIDVRFGMEVPSVMADIKTTQVVQAICQRLLGSNHVQDIPLPSMGGEDFAFYSQRLPAAFVRLGCRGDTVGHFPLHSCQFDIDERVLSVGAQVMTHLALDFF